MKKIVLVSDGKHFSSNVFDFIRGLYEKETFLLTGAFFHSVDYALLIPSSFATSAESYLSITNKEKEIFESSIEEFKDLCIRHNIEYVVHEEGDQWNIDDLVLESRFADLLVINGETFFSDFEKEQPNYFLRHLLKSSECPVLVVPEGVQHFTRIAVAYDGKKESVYALKMFAYLFPNFLNLPVDIYYWVHKTDEEIPQFKYITELAGRHFENLNFRELFFDHDKYMSTWAEHKRDALFICGSYHSAGLLNWFKKDFAEDIIKDHSSAVFIAHST